MHRELNEISTHNLFRNINKNLHNEQCHAMHEYLASNCENYWLPMMEDEYSKYLQKQNKLYEGLITSYPIDNVYNFFKTNGYNVNIVKDHNDAHSIKIQFNKNNIDYINTKMMKYGYYCSYKNKVYQIAYFTPKFIYECTEEVYANNMKLYHLTNDLYIDKILKIGLIPKHQNKIEYDHPDRVYLGLKEIRNLSFISHMFKTMRNKNRIKKLYVLEIDLSKCEDKRFFKDNLTPDGVFTYENIPSHCISVNKIIEAPQIKQ